MLIASSFDPLSKQPVCIFHRDEGLRTGGGAASHDTNRLRSRDEIKILDVEIESSMIAREILYLMHPGPSPTAERLPFDKASVLIYDTPLIISEDNAYPEQMLSREIELCEIFIPHAHPKIMVHRGCAVEEGRVIGFCLTIYRENYGACPR